MAALQLEAGEVFVPLIPVMAAGTCWVLLVAYWFGLKERKRLGILKVEEGQAASYSVDLENEELKRPKLFVINLAMTVILMAMLVTEMLPLNILFMIASALAVVINYGTDLKTQGDRFSYYGTNVLPNLGMVLAAGVFTGIMQGTKMIDAMAKAVTDNIPAVMGPHLAVFTAFTSLPFDYFLTNDAYYYGIVPVLAKVAQTYGISAAEIARASLVAQGCHLLSPLVASTYILIGLNNVTLGELTKAALLPALGSSVVMIIASLVLGVFPL